MTKLYQYDDMEALSTLSLTRKGLSNLLATKSDEIKNLKRSLSSGLFPGFSIAEHKEDLAALTILVANWEKHYEHAVFLGVGGSSLGAQTLCSLMGKYNNNKMEIHFLDNVDPFTIDSLIDYLPLEKTVVISVSKSGGTLETVSQTLLFAQAFQAANLALAAHMLGVTENKKSALKSFLEAYKIPTLNHPENVGGRFTILTLVGMLPAIMAGVDASAVRDGAFEVLNEFYKDPLKSEPALGAAFAVKANEMGRSIQYMMPYSDRLGKLSNWYVQLWAESLGKEGKGSTPIAAVGSTDQHSSLQLMMEGPKDKIISLILPESIKDGAKISDEFAKIVGQDHLASLNMGNLLYSQAHGTADALNANGVPVRTFYTKKLNEKVLGALLMHFMLETAIAGILLDVNTWDQPGVEESKKRTISYLSNPKH